MGAAIDTKMAPAQTLESTPDESPAVELPAFDALYDRTFPLVWRTLQRLGVPHAQLDDSAQEVFAIVHRRLKDLSHGSGVRTWVAGIAVRVASDVRRAARRRGEHVELDEQVVDQRPGPHDQTSRREARRIVDTLLSALDDEKREVFVLAEMEGLSGPEISDALGVKLNTVYSRLRLAREAFENRLRVFRAGSGQP